MKRIIVFIGVIGSGKDHQTKTLLKENKNAVNIGFSDSVRDFTWEFLGWKPEDTNQYESFKSQDIGMKIAEESSHSIQGRKIMERIATKMRSVDNYFWANEWYKKVQEIPKDKDLIIAHDCRYPEEAVVAIEAALKYDAEIKFIHTNFKSERYEIRDHESEHFAQRFLEYGDLEDITEAVKIELESNWGETK